MKVVFLTLLLSFVFSAKTRLDFYVDGVKGHDDNNGTRKFPFKTIQKGVNSAPPNSVVYVEKGEYEVRKPISIYRSINLTLTSLSESFETVIHSRDSRSTFLLFVANSNSTKIKGLTFTSGNDPFVCGGLFIRDSYDTLVEDCIVSDSWGLNGGGGYVWNSIKTVFRKCEFKGNLAFMENKQIESVLVKSEQFVYEDSLFMGNYPSYLQDDYETGFGGALYILDSDVLFDSSVIFNNSAMFGGGLVIRGVSYVNFVNSRLLHNAALLQGSGIFVYDKTSKFDLFKTDVIHNQCSDFRCQVIYSNVANEGLFDIGMKIPSIVPFLQWFGSISGIVLFVNGILQCIYYILSVILSRRKKKLLFSVKSNDNVDEESSSENSENSENSNSSNESSVHKYSSSNSSNQSQEKKKEKKKEKKPKKVDYVEITGIKLPGINNSDNSDNSSSSSLDNEKKKEKSSLIIIGEEEEKKKKSKSNKRSKEEENEDSEDENINIIFKQKKGILWNIFCGVFWFICCRTCDSDVNKQQLQQNQKSLSKKRIRQKENRKTLVNELLTIKYFEEENHISYYCLQIIYLSFGFSNSLCLWRIVHVFLIFLFFISVMLFEMIDQSKTTKLTYDTFDDIRNYIKISNRFLSYFTPFLLYVSMLIFYSIMRKEWRLFNCYNLFFAVTLLLSGISISVLLAIIFYDDIQSIDIIMWIVFGQVLSIFIFSCSTIADYMILLTRQYFIKIRDTFHKPYFQGEKAIIDFIRLKAILKRINESTWYLIIPVCIIILCIAILVVVSSIIGTRVEATGNESVFQRWSFPIVYGIVTVISLIFFSRVTMSSVIWMKRVEGFLLNSRYDNENAWTKEEQKLVNMDEQKYNSKMLFTNAKEMRRTLLNPNLPRVSRKTINELLKFNGYVRSTYFIFRFPFTIDLTFSSLTKWITIIFGCITATSVFSRNFSQILFINQ